MIAHTCQVGTIMRYLLDELMVYEEGYSDIMMGDRAPDRHESFMGIDTEAAISRKDLIILEGNIFNRLQNLPTLPTPPSTPSRGDGSAVLVPAGTQTSSLVAHSF